MSVVELEKAVQLSSEVLELVEEFLCESSNKWEMISRKKVDTMKEMAEELDRYHHGTNVAQIVGSTVGAIGGGISITALSIALSPLTVGASVVFGLGVAGGIVGGSGAVTSIGAMLTRAGVNKSRKGQFVQILDKHQADLTQMETTLNMLHEIHEKCVHEQKTIDMYKLTCTKPNQYSALDKDARQSVNEVIKTLETVHKGLLAMRENIPDTENSDETLQELEKLNVLIAMFDAVYDKLNGIIPGENVNTSGDIATPKSKATKALAGISNIKSATDKIVAPTKAIVEKVGSRAAAKAMGSVISAADDVGKSSGELAAGMASVTVNVIDDIGVGASKTATTGVQIVDDIGGTASKTAANAAKIVKGLTIAGIALAAIGVAIDVINIGIVANDIHKGSKSDLATQIRDIADKMEVEINDLKIDRDQKISTDDFNVQ